MRNIDSVLKKLEVNVNYKAIMSWMGSEDATIRICIHSFKPEVKLNLHNSEEGC